MAETKTVKTLDIQLQNAERGNSTTIKLDNPVDNITREMVSTAMQTPLSQGWFLTNKGDIATYIGDITLNTSIKVKLEGEDFYVTPNTLTIVADGTANSTIEVSGAQIQGYNLKNLSGVNQQNTIIQIAENGLSITLGYFRGQGTGTFDLILIIMGQEVLIPCTVTAA